MTRRRCGGRAGAGAWCWALVLALAAALAGGAAAQGTPLSAIDWLSDSLRIVPPADKPEAPRADVPKPGPPGEVITQPLDDLRADAAGIVPAAAAGLPRDLWAGSESATLAALIARQHGDGLPAMVALLHRIVLAELTPPVDSGPGAELLLARLDKLLDLGALDQAQALAEQAGPDRPEVFRRWFDISLLTGTEARACAAMRATPDLAPTLPARVFCLARSGEWDAAVLTMETGAALGHIDADEADLLARFLDTELFEGTRDPEPPARMTPLVFRMFEAIGLAQPTQSLPRAFAHADLSPRAGLKAQIEAAERLVRSGAIPPGRLFALYTGRRAAASGGVWDRMTAVQALDVDLLAGMAGGVAEHLGPVWNIMQDADLAVPFARHYGERLLHVPLPPPQRSLALRIALLGGAWQAANMPGGEGDGWLAAVARGEPAEGAPPAGVDPLLAGAVTAGLGAPLEGGLLRGLIEEGRRGEALLRAMLRLEAGAAADPRDIRSGLAALRALGLEDDARRAALELVLLDRRG